MALTNMVVFNQTLATVTIQTLGQMIDKFNAASGNTLVLTSEGFEGDFIESSMMAALSGAQRRVDRYSNNDEVSATDLAQLLERGVKIAGGFGPIRMEPGQMTWIQKSPTEAIAAISLAMAEAVLADQLNTAVAVAVAAISNQAAAVHDISGAAGEAAAFKYTALNGAHAKFGDRSARIRATVLDGAAFHKLIENNLNNANSLFRQGDVQVVDILGRTMVVTDAPALRESGTPNLVKAIGLVENGVVIYDGSDFISNVETKNGKKRIESTMQADYTFGAAIEGYSWDAANGGKSPSDADLETGSNWDLVANEIKHSAGVITIASADV
jgi:hypothetical protein